MNDSSKIITIDSGVPGKTLAIFAGVHGNEKAGILALDYLAGHILLKQGKVHLVYANPRAIEQGVRFTEKNLNRCFVRRDESSCYEEFLADELMDLLDTCDALLDMHAYRDDSDRDITFAFCTNNALELASKMHLSKIITKIDDFAKGGSDGYMPNTGKIGICVELGSLRHTEKFKELGITTCYQFMQYFDVIDEKVPFESIKQDVMQMHCIYRKENENFKFTKPFLSFDKVPAGEVIATDGEKTIAMDVDGYVIFPVENDPVGLEAFLFAKVK